MSPGDGHPAGNPTTGHSKPGAARDDSPQDPISSDVSELKKLSLREYGVRFLFGAAISVVAGMVGLRFGLRAGGLFLAFPAILPASLTLIEKKEDTDRAVGDVKGAVLGGAGLVVFALVVHFGAGPLGILALVAGAAAWWLVAWGLYLLVRRTRAFIRL